MGTRTSTDGPPVRGLSRLNVGCGPHYAPGFVNIDLYEADRVPDGRQVDVVCDVLDLPFQAESCSRVYAGHVLEHLSLRDEVLHALREIRRVLAHGGELMVVGPDVARAREGWPNMVSAIVPGERDHEYPKGIPHKWAPTGRTTLELCRVAFPDAQEIPIALVDESWPVVERVGWQFAIHCTRQ